MTDEPKVCPKCGAELTRYYNGFPGVLVGVECTNLECDYKAGDV
jgi:hypothetical protein